MWRLRALRGVCHPHAVFALNLPQLSTRFVWGNRECLIGLAGWRRHPMFGVCDLPKGRFSSDRAPSRVYSPAPCPSTTAFTVPVNSNSSPPAPIAARPFSSPIAFGTALSKGLTRCGRNLHFLLIGWVLMPEHFHVLIKPEPAETTPLIMKGLKEESAKRIIRTLRENLQYPWCRKTLARLRLPSTVHDESHYRLWQRRFYPFNVFSERNFSRNWTTCTTTP